MAKRKKNLLDFLTEYRHYFREKITDRINYCLSADSDEEKAARFEEIQKLFETEFVEQMNTTNWENEYETISKDNRQEFAEIFVEKLFDKYYQDLKSYNDMIRRNNKK